MISLPSLWFVALTALLALSTPVRADFPKNFPASHVPIGFRTVSESRKNNYAANGITYNVATDDQGSQIGPGIYLTPKVGEFDWRPSGTAFFCVIAADKSNFQKTNKIWIPDMFMPDGCDPMDFENEVPLWSVTGLQGEGGNIEDNIQAYFDHLGLTWNTQQTVRISPVSGQANIIQYMLPPGLLKANRAHQAYPLDLEVICSSDEAQMKSDWEGKVLNIDDWNNVNTEGDIHRGGF